MHCYQNNQYLAVRQTIANCGWQTDVIVFLQQNFLLKKITFFVFLTIYLEPNNNQPKPKPKPKPKLMRKFNFIHSCDWVKISLFIFSLSALVTTSFGQNNDVFFDRLSVRDGLSHSNVYTIVQDNFGYLWFGTQDGLNRFDGREIKVFRGDVGNVNSLTTSNFGKMLIDKSGYYWFGTFGGGIDRYDPKTSTFKNFSFNSSDNTSISNNQIIFVFEDSKGVIWFGTPDGGLNRYNAREENFTRFQFDPNNPNSLSGSRAKCMGETPDGTLWVGTNKGLNKFNAETETFIRYNHNPNDLNSLSGDFIQNMVTNSDGSIWLVLHGGGLNHFDVENNKFTHYMHNPNDNNSISDNKADCILKDSNGYLWIGTYDGGLNKFDPQTQKFYRYKHDPSNFFSLSSNRIEYLFEDNSKILWIGTRGGGLNKLDLKPKKFYNIKYNANAVQGLPQHTIMAISSDTKGNIWIGTDGGGLTKYNLESGKFTHLRNDKLNANSLSNNRVWSVHVDKEGVIWAGTYLGGLNRIEQVGDTYNITHFKNNPNDTLSISNNQINCILEDKDGVIWFGTSNGINRLVKSSDKKDYSFKPYFYNTFNKSFASNDNYVNSIIQDGEGRLWVGSYQSGLFEFDYKNESFIHFIPKVDDEVQFLKTLRMLTINVDSQGKFWIGTESGGLLSFDIEQKLVLPHPKNDILKSKMIIGTIEDDDKNLWIVSTTGLYKYSLITGDFNSYTFDDGIDADGFNRNSFHKNMDGQMFFGGIAALTYFHPSQVVNNQYIPKIAITDFKVLTQSIWENALVPYFQKENQLEDVVLSHSDYFFTITFASFDYTSPSKNQYQYMLEGFDKDWIDAGYNTSATYTNLNSGKYVFKVKGTNNDKVWNPEPFEIKLRIKPPFWKHPWFIVLESLILFLIILSFIRYRTYRLRMDKHKLEKSVKERTVELKRKNFELEQTLQKLKETQMHLIQSEKMASVGVLTAGISHEINNPLNYIHGSISIIENYVNENLESHQNELNPLIDIINEGVVRATKIVQSLDQFSRSSEVYTDFCDIHSIIDNCLFMLKRKMDDRVQVIKEFENELPPIQGNEGKLHHVFYNIISNAEQSIDTEGKITIKSKFDNQEVVIRISDTGCGIGKKDLSKVTEPFFTTKDPGKGIGLGLSIAYSIIREHRGRIEFESEKGMGTIVTVTIPVKCS
jgi:signal transduction histidine kinase/ligand-binding sensor domain-containing protein